MLEDSQYPQTRAELVERQRPCGMVGLDDDEFENLIHILYDNSMEKFIEKTVTEENLDLFKPFSGLSYDDLDDEQREFADWLREKAANLAHLYLEFLRSKANNLARDCTPWHAREWLMQVSERFAQ